MDPSPLTRRACSQERTDPLVFEKIGGLFAILREKLDVFLSNPVHENVVLVNLFAFIIQQPVRIDVLDEDFKSTTSPFDTTHEKLTYLHLLLFDLPLSRHPRQNSIMRTLTEINKQVQDLMRDKKVNALVRLIQDEGDFTTLTLP